MANEYDYGCKNGPHVWCKLCPAAGGENQSPINIAYSKCQHDSTLTPLEIKVGDGVGYQLARKQHNFQVSVTGPVHLQGGPLSGQYDMAQFHFHWSESNGCGSEHLMDGQGFPTELHMVFFNKKYGTFAQSLDHPDGLAVVGVFMHISNADVFGMSQLGKHLASSEASPELDGFDLKSLLPGNMTNYFTYPGSLTTPPCTECVTWLVMATAVPISQDTIGKMRATHSKCSFCNTSSNVRTVCPLGSRKLRASFQFK